MTYTTLNDIMRTMRDVVSMYPVTVMGQRTADALMENRSLYNRELDYTIYVKSDIITTEHIRYWKDEALRGEKGKTYKLEEFELLL